MHMIRLYCPRLHGMRDNRLLDMDDPETNMIQSRHLRKFKLQQSKRVMRLRQVFDISLII